MQKSIHWAAAMGYVLGLERKQTVPAPQKVTVQCSGLQSVILPTNPSPQTQFKWKLKI